VSSEPSKISRISCTITAPGSHLASRGIIIVDISGVVGNADNRTKSIVGSSKFVNLITVPISDPINVWGSAETPCSTGIISYSKSFAFGQSKPGSHVTCVAI
jgi:hypothetical protein